MANFTCWHCGRKTRYEGEGYWHCAKCKTSFYEGEDEDGNLEGGDILSVYDAALIWASHGRDEDYTFGYSEEELEAAL